jgi:hypothetical protein
VRLLSEKQHLLKYQIERFGSIETVEELAEKKAQQQEEIDVLKRSLETKSAEYERIIAYYNTHKEEAKDLERVDKLKQENENLRRGFHDIHVSPPQVMNYLNQYAKAYGWVRCDAVLYRQLELLVEHVFFNENDISIIYSKYGSKSAESNYRTAIVSNNSSAWKSIEFFLKRTPFILKNKRIYEACEFHTIVEGKKTKYRCTGWNSDKKIKLVYDTFLGQKRLSFDNKQFKEYFSKELGKNGIVEFM